MTIKMSNIMDLWKNHCAVLTNKCLFYAMRSKLILHKTTWVGYSVEFIFYLEFITLSARMQRWTPSTPTTLSRIIKGKKSFNIWTLSAHFLWEGVSHHTHITHTLVLVFIWRVISLDHPAALPCGPKAWVDLLNGRRLWRLRRRAQYTPPLVWRRSEINLQCFTTQSSLPSVPSRSNLNMARWVSREDTAV